MKRWRKLGPLALAVGLALLAGADGLVASEDQQGVVTATVKVNPLAVSLEVPDEPVSVGQQFVVRAVVENRGRSRIRWLTATLHLDTSNESGLLVRGPVTRWLGVLQPLGSRWTEWRLKAVQGGSYVLMASASGVDASDGASLTAESSAKVITLNE
jgi:hypothetical protein